MPSVVSPVPRVTVVRLALSIALLFAVSARASAQAGPGPPANPAAAYNALVQRYLQGDFNAASEVSAIDRKTVEDERDLIVGGLERELRRVGRQGDPIAAARIRDRLTRTVLAMAVLHTDACLRPDTTDAGTQISIARGTIGVLDGLADRLADSFVPKGLLSAGDVQEAIHQWHDLAAMILAARGGETLEEFLRTSQDRYPKDPVFSLLWGNLQERFAASAVVDVSLVRDVYISEYVIAWRAVLNGARRAYEEALEVDPHATEARLRLGRIETLTGDLDKARKNLDQALSEAGTPRLRYLAALFLGAVATADHRSGEARAHFEQAWSVLPGAESAALALSHLADARGDDAGARKWLERTLGVPVGQRDDPWETYNFTPPVTDLPDRLGRLRALLRR